MTQRSCPWCGDDGQVDCRPLSTVEIDAAPTGITTDDLLPDRWRDNSTRAAGGWLNGELVAVGRIYTSRIHASRYWTDIDVAPDHRGRGHGRQMVDHLAGLRAEPKPLCTRGYVSSETIRFAKHLGASPYQTCPPQQVPTMAFAHLAAGTTRTVSGAAVDRAELGRAWVDTYDWVHASWAPVRPGSEHLIRAELSDVDLTHTRVVATPTIRAAAYVFADPTGTVVVAECRTATEPGGLDLLRACVRDSLSSLAAAGITEVAFDGHDTDPHFRRLLDELPATGEAFELLEWDPSVDHDRAATRPALRPA